MVKFGCHGWPGLRVTNLDKNALRNSSALIAIEVAVSPNILFLYIFEKPVFELPFILHSDLPFEYLTHEVCTVGAMKIWLSANCVRCRARDTCTNTSNLASAYSKVSRSKKVNARPSFMLDRYNSIVEIFFRSCVNLSPSEMWRKDVEVYHDDMGKSLQPFQPLPLHGRHDKPYVSPRSLGEWQLRWVPKHGKPSHHPDAAAIARRTQDQSSFLPQLPNRSSRPGLLMDVAREWLDGPEDRAHKLDSLAPVAIKADRRRLGPMCANAADDDDGPPPRFTTAAWRHLEGSTRFLPPGVPDMLDERRQAALRPIPRARSRREFADCLRHIAHIRGQP